MRRTLLASAITALTIQSGCTKASDKPLDFQIRQIVIAKSKHTLTLFGDGDISKVYRVSLGRGSGAPKRREGDHETPEGEYTIDARNEKSRFHRALHISYPNEVDRQNAKLTGVPPGGQIMIHGIQNGLGWIGPLHRRMDWTDGCVALTDNEMDEIWERVPLGTPVSIQH